MNDLLGLFEDGLRVEANSKLIERNWLLKDEIEVWLHFEFSAYCDKNGNEKIFIETPKVLKDNGDKNDVDAGGVVIHPTECDLSWIRDQDRFGLLVAWRVNSEALDSLLSEGTALGLGGVGALAGLSRGLGGAAAGGTVGGIAGWAIGGAIELTYDEEWEWGFERVWKICCVCTSDNQWKLIIDEKDRINSLDATRGGTFEAEHTGGYPRTAR